MDQFAPRSILCPIDFSDFTPRVLAVASSIASRYSAPLHLVHVAQLPTVGIVDGVTIIPDRGALDAMMASLEDELARAAASLTEGREGLRTHLVQGDPATQIVDLASTERCELVVIGTHGRTGLAHLVMGSVAEHVVRRARVPVLVVPMRR